MINQQASQFLEQFKATAEKLGVKVEIFDRSPRGDGCCYVPEVETIILDLGSIQGLASSINIPELDALKIASYHELGHHLHGSCEVLAWEFARENSGVDHQKVLVAERVCLLKLKGLQFDDGGKAWALSHPLIERFKKLIPLSNHPLLDIDLCQSWIQLRQEYSQDEVKAIAKALVPSLYWSDLTLFNDESGVVAGVEFLVAVVAR